MPNLAASLTAMMVADVRLPGQVDVNWLLWISIFDSSPEIVRNMTKPFRLRNVIDDFS